MFWIESGFTWKQLEAILQMIKHLLTEIKSKFNTLSPQENRKNKIIQMITYTL